MSSDGEVDPRREFWRLGSYEIVGDWLRPASLSVLDRLERVHGSLGGCSLLDVATGTGAVAIEAARRGAEVVGVDITDELLDIARVRATEADVAVRFEVGDFDELDAVVASDSFDVVTSAFGVIFAPDAPAALASLAGRLRPGGILAVSAWDPHGVLVPSDAMLELFPEHPPMLDMGAWSTGLADLVRDSPVEIVDVLIDDLRIPFATVESAAAEFERYSGGWMQLMAAFDGLGVGEEARTRFLEHLDAFSEPTADGIAVQARFHTSVLRRR